jgi:predicted small metal-binding protein
MKTISCREAGFDCDYVVKGETEEEVLNNGIEHAKSHHNMKEEDITDEMKEKIKGIIHTD